MTGTGTVGDPYIIITRADLEAISDDVTSVGLLAEGHYYSLGADIDLTGENWVPIGSPHDYAGFANLGLFCELSDVATSSGCNAFAGHFDGKEHSVTNMKIRLPVNYYFTVNLAVGSFTFPANPRVARGDDILVTFSVDWRSGRHITNVLIDGVSKGVISQYLFTNVTAVHTITLWTA